MERQHPFAADSVRQWCLYSDLYRLPAPALESREIQYLHVAQYLPDCNYDHDGAGMPLPGHDGDGGGVCVHYYLVASGLAVLCLAPGGL